MIRSLLLIALFLSAFNAASAQSLTLHDGICFVNTVFTPDGSYHGRIQYSDGGDDVIRWEGSFWTIRRNGTLLYDNINNTLLPPCSSQFDWWDYAGCDLLEYLEVIGDCSSFLPIELVSFEVIEESDENMTVKWVTASQINHSHFELQSRSEYSGWSTFKEIQSTPLSNEIKEYEYSFNQPCEVTNYRLKSVDLDGTIDYSSTVSFNPEQKDCDTQPFVLNDNGNIHISNLNPDINKEANIRIYTLSGQHVYLANKKIKNESIDLNLELPAGYLIVRILLDQESLYTHRIYQD